MKQSPDHSQLFIKKLTEIMLANLENDKFGVSELAKELKISRSWLNRKVFYASGKTTQQFIHEFRLHKAIEILQNEDVTASEVAYRTGYSSPAYFNTCFHEFFGYTPGQVQKGDSKYYEDNIPCQVYARKEHKNSPGQGMIFTISGIIILLVLTFIFIYPGHLINFNRTSYKYLRSSGERISIAVMPFQNMTNDTTWDVWQDGIQMNLITFLSNNPKELEVRQTGTISGIIQSKSLTYSDLFKPSVASSISQKLEANVFIRGSINQSGSKVRINAQLIESKTQEIIKSFQADGASENILDIIDSVSVMIKNSLIISVYDKDYSSGRHTAIITNSPEAFRYFISGEAAAGKNDFTTAIDWYQQALKIDSNLVQAISGISIAYYNISFSGKPVLEQGKAWCLRSYNKLNRMTITNRIYANWLYSAYFQTPYERIKYLEQLKDIDDQNPHYYFNTGDAYLELFQYNEAIIEFKRALEIFQKWKEKPPIMYYMETGQAYHRSGRYKEENKLYRKAKKYYPVAPDMLEQYAYMAFGEGDTAEGNRYIKKWTSIRKEQSWSDADIVSGLPWIYEMAGMPDKEEECLRKALSLEPENPAEINNLAYFLIDKDLNINEGIELADKVLKKNPDAINAMHHKGWALYKQGKYMEALDFLQKSWDLRMKNYIYNHTAYLHLEAAKKAVANQKRTDL